METKELKKPKVKLSGKYGNVFNLIGICSNALKKANQDANAKEMTAKVFNANSYDEALHIMGQYCELS